MICNLTIATNVVPISHIMLSPCSPQTTQASILGTVEGRRLSGPDHTVG